MESNIVVILIDTLRADHLPFYGYIKNTTPFLTTLSNAGAVFENAYSSSSWTAPATASIFTSLYPFQHGVVTGLDATRRLQTRYPKITLNRIPGEIMTIAEVLKSRGYKTYAVTDNANICKEEGFAQGFDKFKNYWSEGAEVVNNKLKEWKEMIKARCPYFIYIHYNDAHEPYNKMYPWYKKAYMEESDEISAYDSEISYVDDKIREIFNFFEWSDNTLLIVIADHGEEFGDHGASGHSKTLYSEVIHVPFLVYSPNGEFRNRRIEDNVSTIDILPTLRELVGLPPNKHDAGVSLVPYLKGKGLNLKKRYLFSYLWRKKYECKKDIVKKAIIHENWKYIITLPDFEELFNLKSDPREKMNKINEKASIAWSLKARISHAENNYKKYKQEEFKMITNKVKLDKIKSLGYLQ